MISRLSSASCATLILFSLGSPGVQEASDAARTPSGEAIAREDNALLRMGWLAGTWSGPMWGGRFEAHYSTPEAGRMLSHSRLYVDKKVSFYEFEVFEMQAGVPMLFPHPGGRPAAAFELANLDEAKRLAVFENPDKDFPTRISYQRVAEDNLVIILSDPFGESEREERFDLKR